MHANPALKRLGFANTDRVVIFHADDIGMCQASLAAYADLVDFGLLSSAATMVPCPWFPATAAYCRECEPVGAIDMGAHLTLTSEWDNFRWRPISTSDAASGLIDTEGYFHRLAAPVRAQGDPDAVAREMACQIEYALAAGMDLTHIDSHMFTIFHPKFLPVYFQLAFEYRLPPLMVRRKSKVAQLDAYDAETVDIMFEMIQEAEANGAPLIDEIFVMPLLPVEDRWAYARQALADLRPGITCFIIHPAHDTPELRAMSFDWRWRVDDYQLFTSEAWRRELQDAGIQIIGYRALRDLMRS